MTKTYEIGKIYHLFEYKPYRKNGEENPSRNTNTFKMMDLKNPDAPKHILAIEYFGSDLKTRFSSLSDFLNTTKIQIAIVPSSKINKQSKGLDGVLKYITGNNIIYNPNFLVRVKDIQSAHEGGARNIKQHLTSIKINIIPELNVPLILFDDVTTTGCSLEACKSILNNAGINKVYMVALGKTV